MEIDIGLEENVSLSHYLTFHQIKQFFLSCIHH